MTFNHLVMAAILASATGPVAGASDASWQLVWRDEFTGNGEPNARNWNYHVGAGWNIAAGRFLGWGNFELEWYRPENCNRASGQLVVKATRSDAIVGDQRWNFRSCRITTDSKRSILYGAVEVRVRMPNMRGTWPAVWLMGDACDDTSTARRKAPLSYYDTMSSNWASCGEIDIVEHRNSEQSVFQNLHWDTRIGLFPWRADRTAARPARYKAGDVARYHLYRIEWTPTQIQWLVDGKVVNTRDITAENMEEFHRPFHLIIDLAVGGSFPNTRPRPSDLPAAMYVDYVRVYRMSSP